MRAPAVFLAGLALLPISCGGTSHPRSASNAARVVAGMRAGFRACYNAALADLPSLTGCVRLAIVIGPDGNVQRVKATSGGLPYSLVSCVEARASRAFFDPPAGGRAVITVPVGFVPRGDPSHDIGATCDAWRTRMPNPDLR
jgi:hypothetical protein